MLRRTFSWSSIIGACTAPPPAGPPPERGVSRYIDDSIIIDPDCCSLGGPAALEGSCMSLSSAASSAVSCAISA